MTAEPRHRAPDEPELVLASASPRRAELLERVGLTFRVVPADVDESVLPGETADDYVVRVAADKAAVVAARTLGAVVLAADTSVVLDGEVLGKPTDRRHALELLERLSGRNHRVLSAVVVVDPDGVVHTSLAGATVTMAQLGSDELAWYVDSGEPMDKAGAYAVQGRGAGLVERVEGDPTTVIGLPLRATLDLLRAAGVRWPPSGRS
jgi:septum formation protein